MMIIIIIYRYYRGNLKYVIWDKLIVRKRAIQINWATKTTTKLTIEIINIIIIIDVVVVVLFPNNNNDVPWWYNNNNNNNINIIIIIINILINPN